ncbi:MAG: transposase [Gammaproteobacteria bacterium]|nr:transposase [Gammaproteobacteria bacterium]MCW8958454.1 transposase [Gammaproteobacteria bacterium]
MGKLRRFYIANAPVFITSVTHQRRPHLRPNQHKEHLLAAMREVKGLIPYRMLGYVILDDHFHWIIVPHRPEDFPRIMHSVKLRTARRLQESKFWQQRYWDHIIRDAVDLGRHLDYIHYNPVKHGYVDATFQYPWSSFMEHVDRGFYTEDWGMHEVPEGIGDLVPE